MNSFRPGKVISCQLALFLTVCVFAGCETIEEWITPTPAPAESPYVTLQQGWSQSVQERFWFTSQGSHLVQYSWFLALEVADSEQLFSDPSHMREYGYIPFPKFELNPDGLPIGFVRGGSSGNKDWLGLTCAACHTNVLEHGGTQYLIDGAPTLADFTAFFNDMVSAMEATEQDDAKFGRFVDRLTTGGQVPPSREALENFATKSAARRDVNHSDLENGFARLDAFGEILNQVLVFGLNVPENKAQPDAPVSYPFLWGIGQSDVVQWNGVAKNSPKIVGPLGRNTGEVLGVFGVVEIEGKPIPHYPSSVEKGNLLVLEHWINDLRAPKWKETNLPALDPAKVASGEQLYTSAKCKSCHGITSATEYKAVMTPISAVGTDPKMARNFTSRVGKTGPLEGHPKTINLLDKFGDTACASEILSNAVLGVILERPLSSLLPNVEAAPGDVLRAVGGKIPKWEGASESFKRSDDGGCFDGDSYKARPLDSIWATAPYLHNGSVPNLWELLKTEADRVTSFKMGSRSFDPINVGYVTSEGGFTFDTSLEGNLNSGHKWGTELTDDEKWALVEYVKSL